MLEIFNQKKKFTLQEKQFILSTLKNSYPNLYFVIKNNKIFTKQNKNILYLKKLCLKLSKISAENISKKIIFFHKNLKTFKKDPLPNLKKQKEITQIADGMFQFQGEFLKIFRSLNNYFLNLALKKYNATEQENPILWPIELYNKINYFSDFPQQIMMVSSLKKNFKNYKLFSRKYKNNNISKKVAIDKNFRDSSFGLQPAVCDTCYYALSNIKNFNNTVYTTYNKVFRDENSILGNLDRLPCFSVRDIMFVGDKKFVIKIRNKLINSIKNFLKISKLNSTIEIANDPFFISSIEKKIFQDALELKYEVLADIPFLKKKIAIGSINFHLNTFGRAFKICKGKKFVFSGCVGIGFERLLLALYSQHGTNVGKWPKNLRKIININK